MIEALVLIFAHHGRTIVTVVAFVVACRFLSDETKWKQNTGLLLLAGVLYNLIGGL